MRINGIEIDPAANPAVLDTCTWDVPAAQAEIEEWAAALAACADAVRAAPVRESLDRTLPSVPGSVPASAAVLEGTGYFLVKLPDGQWLLVAVGKDPSDAPVRLFTAAGSQAVVFPANVATIKWAVNRLLPHFGPRALGGAPRLGIGNRHSTVVWPGIIAATNALGMVAETIQNSAYRELAPLDTVLSPPTAEVTYLPGHGSLSVGHTGSSIEGLWLAGVLAHIEHGVRQPYGADLDHVPVRSLTEEGLSRARELVYAGRHYSFFTLDTSALFDLSKDDPGGRYGPSIEAAVEMFNYIKALKGGEDFDFEFSLDEGPSISTAEELRFVLDQLTSKGASVQFIAPNVGFMKRVDYGLPDGMQGLLARVREMAEIASEYGATLDFHSGSDKSSLTYRTISEAAGGRLKLKVSGKLQLILAEVLAEAGPEMFSGWWDYTLQQARAEKDAGSEVAATYLQLAEERMKAEGASFSPRPDDRFFTDFSFAMVGARSPSGDFLYRHLFYALPPEVVALYGGRVRDYVMELASDLSLG